MAEFCKLLEREPEVNQPSADWVDMAQVVEGLEKQFLGDLRLVQELLSAERMSAKLLTVK